MQPSEVIKKLTIPVAMQRLRKAKANAPGGMLLSEREEQNMLQDISQEPMTWVVAILTYLDEEAKRLDANEKEELQRCTRPSSRLQPCLSIDGNQWCVLYGLDLVQGVAGFGDTPEAAMLDFDKNWLDDDGNRRVALNAAELNAAENGNDGSWRNVQARLAALEDVAQETRNLLNI